MEIFLVTFAILFSLGVILYLADLKGWNKTISRASRIVRSNVVSRRDRTSEIEAAKDWDAQFSGKPRSIEVKSKPKPSPKLRHSVSKTYVAYSHGYEEAIAVCKCGTVYDEFTSIHGQDGARRKARRDLESHIAASNEGEQRLAKSGGRFEF